ncbi:MAG: type II secretion system F family protein [Patescibacteria group bacterium]
MFKKISSEEIVDFSKNLAVMLKSGITINEALATLSDQASSRKLQEILKNVKKDVEMGTSLADAFAKEEKIFGKVFIVFLRAGEASGNLEKNLAFLADWMEHNNDLRKSINSATLYPKIVFSATLILGGGLAVFILPRLVPLFQQLNVQLPLFTRILMAIAFFLQKFWLVVLICLIALLIFFIFINKIRLIKRFFHSLYLKTPFIGKLLIEYQLALLSQIFSVLLRSGLTISESLDIAAEIPTNILYQESIGNCKKRVVRGTVFSETLKDYPQLYPKNMINILNTAERSGTLEESFFYLADFYSKEVNNRTKRLPVIIEPILLIFIGLALGFVALAIIMPIYQITKGFGH